MIPVQPNTGNNLSVAFTPQFQLSAGYSHALGANWDGAGVNFALFSAHAERVELCIYDPSGRRERERITLPECTDQVWHGYVAGLLPGDCYGYRVHGPYDPAHGHRFNPNKLLVDPYAKLLRGDIKWSDVHLAYRSNSPREDLSFDRRDNARAMPKAVVVDHAYTWGDDKSPQIHPSDSVIYEAHVRGMTIQHQAIDSSIRGTFAALGDIAIIQYLKALGVTSIELLPVHHFVDDRFLVDKDLRNYWGYSTLNYFAPEQRYLSGTSGNDLAEVKQVIRKFHDAGIEVILDVVYNHTCEGDHRGPTLSFKGIDNLSYYRLMPDDKRYYINDTGCGNTLNVNHPRVLQMVMDSLRYWVTDMHVDGFRFDLASTLARDADGFNRNSAFLSAVGQDPTLSRVKMIAEPWDIGPGGYQLGGFPAGWSEWNDKYRDTIRKFWRGDEGLLPEFAGRVFGSSEQFNHSGRGLWSSVNFVTTHDGYTLTDTVSYKDRHNLANGEDNRDGHSANYSDNYGIEGPTDSVEINAFRDLQRRNMLATVLLSQGVPMILAGDEFGRTQQGNNNAYCQDNELNWLDWSQLETNAEFHAFVQAAITLRRTEPLLRLRNFISDGDSAVTATWCDPAGQPMQEQQWQESFARCVILLLSDNRPAAAASQHAVSAADTGSREASRHLVLAFNASKEMLNVTFPRNDSVHAWHCRLDTSQSGAVTQAKVADNFEMAAHSVSVYSAERTH